ncbi:MAG: fibronectin type III domain-containing protein, partial [Dolichospermum sp.]
MRLFFLLFVISIFSATTNGQSAYVMSNGNKTWNFADIANWTNNFASGTDASNWSSVAIIGTGNSVTSGTRTTKASDTWVSGSTGGIQKGTQALVFLSTGSSATPEAVAVDLLLDFTGRNAGTLSFNWAIIDNSSGTRPTSLRIFWSINNSTFTEITSAQVLDQVSSATGSITNVSLPTEFSNTSTARLRFYNHAGSITGSGARDKMQIDDVSVTSTPLASTPTLTTPTVSSITTTSATLGATITSDGGSSITERGTVWGSSANPTTNPSAEGGTSVAAFTHTRTGLTANTLYTYRGYAINGSGTGYSPDGTFTTLHNAPTIGAGSGETASSFTANWSAPTSGGAAPFTYQLQVDNNNDFSSPEFTQSNISSGTTSLLVNSGLAASTTYYYRVRVNNAGGSSAWS